MRRSLSTSRIPRCLRLVGSVFAFIAAFLAGRGEFSDAAEVSGLFRGAAPAVEVTAREATIRSPEGTPTPCYLSVADGVAITTAEIPEVNFQHFGELVVWDLSTGQVRHAIRTPARIMAIAGLRGSELKGQTINS